MASWRHNGSITSSLSSVGSSTSQDHAEPNSFTALRSGTPGGLHPLPLTPSLVRAQEPTREKSAVMIYTVTDTAELVEYHHATSAPEINDIPHTQFIHVARNLELVVNTSLVGALERLGQLHAAKSEALNVLGIPSLQLAKFHR